VDSASRSRSATVIPKSQQIVETVASGFQFYIRSNDGLTQVLGETLELVQSQFARVMNQSITFRAESSNLYNAVPLEGGDQGAGTRLFHEIWSWMKRFNNGSISKGSPIEAYQGERGRFKFYWVGVARQLDQIFRESSQFFSSATYDTIMTILNEKTVSRRSDKWELLCADKTHLKKLKERDPRLYDKLLFLRKATTFAGDAQLLTESRRSRVTWLTVNLQVELEGKRVDLGQYMTWIEVEKEIENKRSPRPAPVYYIHPNHYDLGPLFDVISKIFEEALTSATEVELKEKVSLIEYLMTYAKPFSTSNDVVTDILARALYLHHQFTLRLTTVRQNKGDTNEILTLSFPSFFDQYQRGRKLDKLSGSK